MPSASQRHRIVVIGWWRDSGERTFLPSAALGKIHPEDPDDPRRPGRQEGPRRPMARNVEEVVMVSDHQRPKPFAKSIHALSKIYLPKANHG